MNLYPLLVFIHVLGAVGIYTALGIEAVGLGRLRQDQTTAGARTWMDLISLSGRIGRITMPVAVLAGAGLMFMGWGRQPWITSAIVGIVAMAFAGIAVSGRRMRRLGASLAAETGAHLSDAFRRARSSPALAASLRLRITIGLGILALMTGKPGTTDSLLILAAAILAGVAASLPLSGAQPTAPAPLMSGAPSASLRDGES